MKPPSPDSPLDVPRWHGGNAAKQAYEAYACAYDDANSAYRYERWTGRLLKKAEQAGLHGDHLLDIGCGTGLSFISMLDRGWRVTACDISPAMLEHARKKAGGRATLLEADVRELPTLGQFDLAWAVNDALNYLLSGEELKAALAGMRRNLKSDGVVLFDLNTLACYRTFFCGVNVNEQNGRRFTWEGQASPQSVRPGCISEARFVAEDEPSQAHLHRQRHFPEGEVIAALKCAGFDDIAVFGELDGDLLPGFDEEVNTKAVYVARPHKVDNLDRESGLTRHG